MARQIHKRTHDALLRIAEEHGFKVSHYETKHTITCHPKYGGLFIPVGKVPVERWALSIDKIMGRGVQKYFDNMGRYLRGR